MGRQLHLRRSKLALRAHFDAVHVQNDISAKGSACQSDASVSRHEDVDAPDEPFRCCPSIGTDRPHLQMGGNAIGQKGL